jgi:hypothetical protein
MSSKETLTLGQLIDSLDRVRDLKRKIQGDLDKCKAKENELQARIIEMASEQGLSKVTGGTATASISRSIVPVAVDWEKTNAWILRHKALDLFQKRLSPVSYRERLEDHPRGIPGLESHEQVRLNLRKL